MEGSLLRLVGFAFFLVLGATLSGCASPPTDPADGTLFYLAGQDLRDSTAIQVLEATVGLVDPTAWPSADGPLLDRVGSPATTGDLLRLVRGLAGHGLDPRDFRGTDLVAQAWEGFGDDGYGSVLSLTDDAWALRSLVAAGEDPADPRLQDAVARLRATQAEDGGWAWDGGPAGDPDVTAWVAEALESAGAWVGPDREAAVAFLRAPGPDGGHVGAGVGANCQSTGLALHVLGVLGEALPSGSVAYLASCRHDDGGYRYKPDADRSDLWATLDILPVLPYLVSP